jgi:hypothetical protein
MSYYFMLGVLATAGTVGMLGLIYLLSGEGDNVNSGRPGEGWEH